MDWIKVDEAPLPKKDTDVLCIIERKFENEEIEYDYGIRWRSVFDDAKVDENGFVIYVDFERVIAWMDLPSMDEIIQRK